MKFQENPEFKQVFFSKVHNKAFYAPSDVTEYHISRRIVATAQANYASAGITKELLQEIANQLIKVVNVESNNAKFRSDVAVLANNLLYRTAYPVDEDASIRIGATYTFIDGEDPNNYSNAFTMQKEELARGNALKGIAPDPNLYAFFLSMGLSVIPSYQDLLQDLNVTEYLENRRKTLATLQPIQPTRQ